MPLYKEYGVKMFSMLDAEFALIMYDAGEDKFIAARDSIGIRPLYYGYDESGVICFASEPKNLVGIVGKIMTFPPGHYYIDGQFISYNDLTKVERVCYDDVEMICKNIHDKLVSGVEKRLVADAKVGFLLSGGLDSSFVCAIAAKKSKQVQMTAFPEGSVENPSLSEDFPVIKGSVPQMIEATLSRIKTLFLREKVVKIQGQAEAVRIWNYPYQAIEEAVVNAFYHRDYMSCEPITIEIEPDCINIMNFPGIDRSISSRTIEEGKRFVSRYYRNRRLGEFLKELDLSEGHSSGVPTIQEELEKNGSPKAIFHTDEDRRAMRIQIPIHPAFIIKGNEPQNEQIEEAILRLIEFNRHCSRKKMAEELNVSLSTIKRVLKQMKDNGMVEYVGPSKGGYWKSNK